MRITQQIMSDDMLNNLNNVDQSIAKWQDELSSGKQLRLPSDNPLGVSNDLQIREAQSNNAQYTSSSQDAASWMSSTDNALSSLVSILQSARQLTVQASNDTASASDRAAISNQLQQLMQETLQIANSNVAGKYIFGGFKTTTPPWSLAGAVATYSGDAGQIMHEISDGVQIQVNLDPSFINSIFTTLNNVATTISTGNGATISNQLSTLDATINTVSQQQSINGSRLNRVNAQINTLGQQGTELTKDQSQIEDADIPTVVTQLSEAQAVFQAALATDAKSIQPTLVQFLQ